MGSKEHLKVTIEKPGLSINSFPIISNMRCGSD